MHHSDTHPLSKYKEVISKYLVKNVKKCTHARPAQRCQQEHDIDFAEPDKEKQ